MICLRCDMEIKENELALKNEFDEYAHDDCLGIDDFNEKWTYINKCCLNCGKLADHASDFCSSQCTKNYLGGGVWVLEVPTNKMTILKEG